MSLPSSFDFASAEPEIYRMWSEGGWFAASATRSTRQGGDREPYTVMMPPLNAMSDLHIGHALGNTIQDVIVRWARMRGCEVLWVPATDHAVIETHSAVERALADQGLTRKELGREAFQRRIEEALVARDGLVVGQLKTFGVSADWTRTAYTLAPSVARAVRTAFVELFRRGLIYRGRRIVHWCPRCRTSLSDDEVHGDESPARSYHVAYHIAGTDGRDLVVRTTRPETLLGCAAVVVHPDDARYADLIGRRAVVPIIDHEVPIIADASVDPAEGAGAFTVSPGHDSGDFEIAQRHSLSMPTVIDEAGIVRPVDDADDRVPEVVRGLPCSKARDLIVQLLRTSGALQGVTRDGRATLRCQRCRDAIEPRPANQWFVQMKRLVEPAVRAVRDGHTRLIPERWEASYLRWLESIRDWNISRQLWWGHRVPVWHCDKCDPPGNAFASSEDLEACPQCGGTVRQDEDVLDTWFSTALWPMAALGWPDPSTSDMASFYPVDTIVMGPPQLLFFWVARMLMFADAFTGRVPFHTVYVQGTVRDTARQRMSRFGSNRVDPVSVVKRYGADALRWTLIAGMGHGSDIVIDPTRPDQSFAPGRKFGAKLWNIGRAVLDRVGAAPVAPIRDIEPRRLSRADAWILSRLNVTIDACNRALGDLHPAASGDERRKQGWGNSSGRSGLRLKEYAEAARQFVWNDFADWYLEDAKRRLDASGDRKGPARTVLIHVFDAALRLLHPLIPFVTEALWQRLPAVQSGEVLMAASWPAEYAAAGHRIAQAAAEFEFLREAIHAFRAIRQSHHARREALAELTIVPAPRARVLFEQELETVAWLAQVRVGCATTGAGLSQFATRVTLSDGSQLLVPFERPADVEAARARMREELADLDRQIEVRMERIRQPYYLARAPAHVVGDDQAALTALRFRREQVAISLQALRSEVTDSRSGVSCGTGGSQAHVS
jgi:valyl-tRNA synthetase